MSAQAERAEKLAELFKAAAEAGEASWPLYLNQALDTDMRADLEALLQQHARAKTFWETPALSHAAGSFVAESSRVGERIAQYEVLSLIGSGGMGDVYLARDLRLSRQVALKVIRHGMDSADIVRRFEHEERLLAGLNHPNIAQLYGGGVTNDGVPYFVLEHVQGIRIDQYCKGTGLRELLELFCKVCAAVTYAHQHLVVHRDLKPSNILVTAEGEPKLLDFGIAKLLDNTAEADFRTLTIAPILTPEYASPEHVLGETITTASDVYSLGVLLYELLTGVKPYRIEGRTPAEIARVVTEHEAARPSATVSRGQRSEIGSRKSFRGDLDNIVLMAMRKEPDRRYPSVAAYAADIRRHLDGLPVRARQDTLAYRSSKFIARNRIAVAAAVLVGLAVVAALIVSLVETQSARRERDLAERERLKAERINQFLQNILGAAAPETKGTEVKLKQVIDEASQRARKELLNEPEVMADVLLTLGRTYVSAGRFSAAEKDLRAALDTSLRTSGELNETSAATLAWLGLTLAYQHKTDEGERVSHRAVELERKLHPSGHESLGVGLYSLGLHLTARNDLKDAEPTLTEAAEVIERSLGTNHGYYLATLSALGTLYEKAHNFDKAQQLYQRAIDLSEHVEPRYQIFRALVESYLARLLIEKGNYEKAEPLLRESENFYRKESSEPSSSVGQIMQFLGIIALNRSDYPSAEADLRESLDILQKRLPPEHPAVAKTVVLLGLTLTRENRAGEGETLLRKALEVQKKSGSDRVTIDDTQGALGECLMRQQRYEQAEPLLLESYNDFKASLGDKHPRTIEAGSRLTSFYQATGRKPKDLTRSSGNVEP